MTNTLNSNFVSIKTYAEMYDYSQKHVRKLVQAGNIPAIRLVNEYGKNNWRIDLNQLQFESNIPDKAVFNTKKKEKQQDKQEVVDIIAHINSL